MPGFQDDRGLCRCETGFPVNDAEGGMGSEVQSVNFHDARG